MARSIIILFLLAGCSADLSGDFDKTWQKIEITAHAYDTREAVMDACKNIFNEDYEACATWGSQGNHIYFKRPNSDADFNDIGHELWHILVGAFHE